MCKMVSAVGVGSLKTDISMLHASMNLYASLLSSLEDIQFFFSTVVSLHFRISPSAGRIVHRCSTALQIVEGIARRQNCAFPR